MSPYVERPATSSITHFGVVRMYWIWLLNITTLLDVCVMLFPDWKYQDVALKASSTTNAARATQPLRGELVENWRYREGICLKMTKCEANNASITTNGKQYLHYGRGILSDTVTHSSSSLSSINRTSFNRQLTSSSLSSISRTSPSSNHQSNFVITIKLLSSLSSIK
jgi:hypothetical protein